MRQYIGGIAICCLLVIRSSEGKPPTNPRACGSKCGTERWGVKTMTDQGANQVDSTAVPNTVAALYAITAPSTNPNMSRGDEEKKQFTVRARLVGYKIEFDPNATKNPGDRDFHIVIADLQDPTKTMVVEIPDPRCAGVCSSSQLDRIKQARQTFTQATLNHPPSKSFIALQKDVEVEVTGPAMFDFEHGQTGLAKNCIEIHPVLEFKFITPGPY